MPAPSAGMMKSKHPVSACAEMSGTNAPRLYRLMDDRFLPQASDLVLDMQLTPLEFYNLKVVGGGVGERFVQFGFKRLVPFFEFRKMRFNRHVACLLASAYGRDNHLTPAQQFNIILRFRRFGNPCPARALPCGRLTKTR
jgi:hypothetical protein